MVVPPSFGSTRYNSGHERNVSHDLQFQACRRRLHRRAVDLTHAMSNDPQFAVRGTLTGWMLRSFTLPNILIAVMATGIVLPSVMYSLSLRSPTPAELLIAICIALVSNLLFLW